MAETEQADKTSQTTFAEFLQSSPPDSSAQIKDLAVSRSGSAGTSYSINRPDIELHGSSPRCDGLRMFCCTTEQAYLPEKIWAYKFLTYNCRNCRTGQKSYALALWRDDSSVSGRVVKFGEHPAFGPSTPSRVITLIGPDKELFLQGRRAENRGFGIGAFAYYRRVVENQKGRIIEEIGKVAKRLGAKAAVLKTFEDAAQETQFTKAIDTVKPAFPDMLLIYEQNPLTLLHKALSEVLHAQTDAECLEFAQDIRLVLTELAERISQALKEEAELKSAVGRLVNRKPPETPATSDAAMDGGPPLAEKFRT